MTEQRPASQPASQQPMAPAGDAASRPATDRATAPAGDAASQPATDRATAAAGDAASQPATDRATTAAGDAASRPATDRATAPAGDAASQPAADRATIPAGDAGDTASQPAGHPADRPANARVAAALTAAGATTAAAGIRRLADSTRTAAEAAAALGVPVGAIVKSLVFTADGEPLLVLASGDHQVDTAHVATTIGAAQVKRADPDTVRAATGFAIGGVAPVGHPGPLRTVVDTHLATYPVVWAAAGTPHAVFPTSYDELLRVTDGIPAAVAGP